MMKNRISSILLCLLLLAAFMPLRVSQVHAAGSVQINSTNFPDSAFRTEISTFDLDGNGSLSATEIKKVKELDVSGKKIKKVNGIEFFTSLKILNCSQNALTSLNISANTALEELHCAWNQLTSLDVSNNTALTYLSCESNALKTLDVKNNTKLEALFCEDNSLKTLDVSHNPDLHDLSCEGNLLTKLDVSKNTELEYLYCTNNLLTSLDVSKNQSLYALFCFGNQIVGLDISGNEYLKATYLYHTDKEECEDYVILYGQCDTADEMVWTALGVDYGTNVYVSVTEKPKITKQAVNRNVLEGTETDFEIYASGVTKCQWYYRTTPSGTWTAVSAVSGRTLHYTLTAKAKHDGYQYRCKLTNAAGSVYSSVRTLSVTYAEPSITVKPKAQTVAVGSNASFTVGATGGGLEYQWYYRTPDASAWTKVSAASGKTKTYSLTAKERHDGYQYRCKVSNAAGYVYTSARTLTVVTEKPTITTQPVSKSVAAGKTATFTVKAGGKGLSYQWYYRTSSSGAWTAVSADSGKTASYSLTTKARHNGYQYRCKITNPMGNVYTKVVTLTVK